MRKFSRLSIFFTATAAMTAGQGMWTWQYPAMPAGRSIHAAQFTGATTGFAVGEDGVVLKTADGGETWTWQTLGPDLYSIAFPEPTVGYAMGHSGELFKTTDAGTSWSRLDYGQVPLLRSVVFTDARTGFAIGHAVDSQGAPADRDGLYKTTDGGLHWAPSLGNPRGGIGSVHFPAPDTGYCYGVFRDDPSSKSRSEIIRTFDGGKTWSALPLPDNLSTAQVEFPTARNGFLVTWDGNLLSTDDAALTWKPLPDLPEYGRVKFRDAVNGYLLTESDTGPIYKTADGGKNWSLDSDTALPYLNALAFAGTGEAYAFGPYGVIMKSGPAWKTLKPGDHLALNDIAFLDARRGFAVGDSGALLATDDGGDHWTMRPTGTRRRLDRIRFLSPSLGYASVDSGAMLKTIDAGATWTPVGSDSLALTGTFHFLNENLGFAPGKGIGKVWKTVDGGRSWSLLTVDSYYQIIEVFFLNADTGFASGTYTPMRSGAGALYRTLDGGKNWTQVYWGGGGVHGFLFLQFPEKAIGYVVDARTRDLVKTTDGGAKWAPPNPKSFRFEGPIHFINASVGFTVAGPDNVPMGHLMMTRDGGLNWTPVAECPKAFRFVFADSLQVYGLAEETRIFRLNLAPGSIPVLPRKAPRADAEFRNGDLHFWLPIAGRVEALLFDLRGKRVARLFEGPRAAGSHREPVAPDAGRSGVFLLQLRGPGETHTLQVRLRKP